MAGIITDFKNDIQRLNEIKQAIAGVKNELKSINIKVNVDIKESLEAKLQSLMKQYDTLVLKICEAEGKIMISTKKMTDATNKVIQAQEKLSAGVNQRVVPIQSTQANNTAEIVGIQVQAKAYDDLSAEIQDVLNKRELNISSLIKEQKAVELLKKSIAGVEKGVRISNGSPTSGQIKLLEHYNKQLLTHKAALLEVRQVLNNNAKLDNSAATSMDALAQSLSRMRITYRGLTEEERKSPFGKELLTSINQADTKIKELDASIGNHARNVGNYKKQWNGLQYQMQMVAREMPNFAINPQIGIMSLTNNIPYLVDELKKAKDAHKAYVAEVKAGNKDLKAVPSVGKQVLSSLFSWQTAIIMGITLITAYRKEISEWVTGLFKAKDVVDSLVDVQSKINNIQIQGTKNAQSELTKLDALYKASQSDIYSKQERLSIIKKLQQEYPNYFGNLSEEAILAGKAESAYNKLAESITKAAVAKAFSESIAENAKETIDLENELDKLLIKKNELQKEQNDNFNNLGKGTVKATNASRKIYDLGKKIADNGEEILKKQTELRNKQSEKFKLQKKLNSTDFIFNMNGSNPIDDTKQYWEEQKNIAMSSISQIKSEYLSALKLGNTKGVPSDIIEQYNNAIQLKQKAEKTLSIYSDTPNINTSEKLRQQQEKYKLLLSKQALEQKRSSEDLQMQSDEARINAMEEGNAKMLERMKFNHQKEMKQLDRQQEDYLRKKIENIKSAFEANPSNKGKSFSKVYEGAVNTQKTGDEMVSLFGGGNVDLLARPMIDAAKLVEKGWKDAGTGIATVFSSAYEIEQDGKNVSIQVTPILPDGTALSQNELESYIDTQLNGAKDVLEADNKGIIIHVDTDVSPEKAEAFGQKLHEYQEKYYDGVSGLSKQGFSLGDFALSKSEKEYYSMQKEFLNIQHENETKTYYKDILKEYQDYTDKRLAIEKKYNDDIAVLETQRAQAVKDGDFQQIEQIDRMKSQAIKKKGEDLMHLDYEQLKKSPEYIRAFENLKNTSTETLNSLLSQLEAAKQTAAEVLNPEDLREYTSTIQSIVDELTERNPFQTIINKKKELAQAEQELAEAKKQLDATEKKGYTILAKYDEKTGKTVYTYLTATEALKNYNKAKDHVIDIDNKLQDAEKKVSEQINELGVALKNVGDTIGGTSGEIISLMGDIFSFTSLSMESITKLSGEAATEISALEKASVILGIISAAIQLLQQINSLLGDAHSQYEGYAEKIKEINALTDAVNDYRIAALEAQQAEKNWFSEDNLQNLRDYKALHDEVAKAYDKKANEAQAVYQNEGGGGWLTAIWKPITTFIDKTYGKIFGFNINKEYKEGTTKAVENLRIETRKKSKGFLGTGIGGHSQKTEDLETWARNNGLGELFDDKGLLNKELAQSLIDNYGDKLVGQTKETLESLVELREKYDEYIEQLHEYVSSLYEPLVDNFVDSIWDWLDTGKDALDSFKEYASDTFRDIVSDMIKTIALEKIFNNEDIWGKGESYQSQISKAYEDYASGLIDEVELNRRVSELTQKMLFNAESQLPAIQGVGENIIDTIYKSTGIDLRQTESTSQNSTKKGFEAMSQDSADELNGRFTALQMSGEEIKNQNILQSQSLNLLTMKSDDLLKVNYEVRNIADETRDLIVNSYLELMQISENTGNSAKYLKDIKADISEVKRNTSRL